MNIKSTEIDLNVLILSNLCTDFICSTLKTVWKNNRVDVQYIHDIRSNMRK